MIEIREASADDLTPVADVKARGWRTSYAEVVSPERLAEFGSPAYWLPTLAAALRDDHSFVDLVAKDDAVVGMAQGHFSPTPYLTSLHVLSECRGQGIGALLMAHLARSAMDRGHSTLELDVVATNTRAIAFYWRLGAAPAGEHPASWAPGVIEMRMIIADLSRLLRRAGSAQQSPQACVGAEPPG